MRPKSRIEHRIRQPADKENHKVFTKKNGQATYHPQAHTEKAVWAGVPMTRVEWGKNEEAAKQTFKIGTPARDGRPQADKISGMMKKACYTRPRGRSGLKSQVWKKLITSETSGEGVRRTECKGC